MTSRRSVLELAMDLPRKGKNKNQFNLGLPDEAAEDIKFFKENGYDHVNIARQAVIDAFRKARAKAEQELKPAS